MIPRQLRPRIPAAPEQSDRADIDAEYQMRSDQRAGSISCAARLLEANALYAKDCAAEVTNDMPSTDSGPSRDFCPAVSVRENRRRAEMPNGAAPHWDRATDVYEPHSERDFLFGLNTVQTTVSAIATLAGVSVGDGRQATLRVPDRDPHPPAARPQGR